MHLYFGAAIDFVGVQLLMRRVADKVRQVADKVSTERGFWMR